MHKYNFFNDYSEGAHPTILELLAKTNLSQETGYGEDSFCREAAALLKRAIGNEGAAVHFVTGGTQANLIALSSLLKSYEAVIAATTAHINVHEAGALEATGHKILTVATTDGKLTPALVQEVVDAHTDEHMVKPRVVAISNSTEIGTLYRRDELAALAQCCRANGLYLYLDGARLGAALTGEASDLTLPELADLVDIFYIGGTKNGALLGEAIVINTPALQADFRFHLKQRGALLAKGRVLGLQFIGLFRDGLYFELARHANAMAMKLARGLAEQGFRFLAPPATNQIFPILPHGLIARLQESYGFYVWSKVDADHAAIRLVTSWATEEERVDEFLADVRAAATRGFSG
ncbi:MAG: threonine aldolase family protein [Anaerolineae bacterium]